VLGGPNFFLGPAKSPERPDPAIEATAPAPARARARRQRRRIRWRPFLRKLHGWLALATGVVLLLVVLSGTILLFQPELSKIINPGLYESTPTEDPITPAEALRNVREEMPKLNDASTIVLQRGIYMVYTADYARQINVDPGTGEVLGASDSEAGFLGFVSNLHLCGLSCKGYPGYIPWLKNRVEVLGNRPTIGGLILGISALVLIVLSVSGLFLWWPGIKRMAKGLKVRRGKGRYATHYDLHKVFGFVALPFLLMWAFTGASFEFEQFEKAWYGILPGEQPDPKELPTFESKPGSGDGINPAQAQNAALAAVPGAELTSITLPGRDDRKGYYDVWLTDGYDSFRASEWPGDAEVAVDRWSGRTQIMWSGPEAERPASQVLWEDWSYPIHAGLAVGWLPRGVWLAFGLVPLMLAVTGVTVWWIRRRKRRAKRGRTPAGGAGANGAA